MATGLNTTARWLRWLTPGLQIKRWLLLLMASELVSAEGWTPAEYEDWLRDLLSDVLLPAV